MSILNPDLYTLLMSQYRIIYYKQDGAGRGVVGRGGGEKRFKNTRKLILILKKYVVNIYCTLFTCKDTNKQKYFNS